MFLWRKITIRLGIIGLHYADTQVSKIRAVSPIKLQGQWDSSVDCRQWSRVHIDPALDRYIAVSHAWRYNRP
jgi:hypothetical protein